MDYIVSLSSAEDKALKYVTSDPQGWIDNAVKNRCRIAIDEIASIEVERKLSLGESIQGTKEDIVLAALIPSAAEREAEIEAQRAQMS